MYDRNMTEALNKRSGRQSITESVCDLQTAAAALESRWFPAEHKHTITAVTAHTRQLAAVGLVRFEFN